MIREKDYDKDIKNIIKRFKIKLIFAIYVPQDIRAYYNGEDIFVKGYSNPNTIETIGSGDKFYGVVLSKF